MEQFIHEMSIERMDDDNKRTSMFIQKLQQTTALLRKLVVEV